MERDGEILKLRAEKDMFDKAEENRKESFAEELRNGLGDSMIQDLRNPERTVVKKGFSYSFSKWWRELKEGFQIMFYNKEEK